MIRGLTVLVLLTLNLFFWGTLVLLLSIFKRRLVLTLARLAERWVGVNNRIFDALLPIEWRIEGGEGLRRDGRYLIFANHISWADIFVIFRALHGKVPFIRFFIKQELVWLPIVGQASWALEFPFMKRDPEKRADDLETTRRACQRYREIPVAVLNFLEGTRFTPEKHAEQNSPYDGLLRPRIGAAAFALASLGDVLDGVLDVTIAYPGHVITFWDLISGRVKSAAVHIRRLEVPPQFLTPAVTYPGPTRDGFKLWIHETWSQKQKLVADS